MAGESVIGAYGDWAASLSDDPGSLSLRGSGETDLASWRDAARERVADCLARPDRSGTPRPDVEATYEHDGLRVEELTWRQSSGEPTRAVLLKPAGAEGPLPAVLGLHDHGGTKYFGRRKIARTDRLDHPSMADHRAEYYGGRPWANALAKRGYAVLVHDGFAFGSRRVRLGNVTPAVRDGTPEPSDDDPDAVRAYDAWAKDHESVLAKSLFAAGTTWPGVSLAEDQRALDVLCAREDVDADRVGCGGLSGGGLRTVFLGGMDDRVESAVCTGMLTTWRDFVVAKSPTHTWMCYVPLVAADLDYPEILGLRVPKPTLVSCNRDDPLFTSDEMHRADDVLGAVYEAADARDSYRGSFHDGSHKFDRAMQNEAFAWFDETL